MKITSLHIDNFMGMGHADLALDDKGLVLIQGDNQDDPSAVSNGAGKSSLADAIFWCLFGETARGCAADEVVSTVTKKDCQVVIEIMAADGSQHIITRWRKKNVGGKRSGVTLEQVAGGKLVFDLTKGTDKLTQVEIDRVLGCSKEVFTAAVYAGQEALPNLPAMTDTELKTLIESASGVDTLVRAYKIARERLTAAQADQDRWRLNHVRFERDVQEATDRLADLTTRTTGYEAQRRTNIVNLHTTLKGHVETARAEQARRDSVNPVNVQNAIDALDVKINAVSAEQDEETRLSIASSEAAGKHTAANAVCRRATEDAQRQGNRFKAVKDQVGTPCTECGKPYEAHDLAAVEKLAREKLSDLIVHARDLKEDAEACGKIAANALQMLQEYRAARTDITATVNERRRLAEHLGARTTAENAMASETAAALRVKAQIDALKVEANPYTALSEKAQADQAEALRVHRESEEAGVSLETQVQVCKEVVKVYGPAGVRAHILDNVTPYLNDRTADYLGVMSDGRISAVWSTLSLNAKGELTEKFAINVNKDGGGGSFASLSGGEKRKVRLACALALQDLVASRATKPIGIMIYDEVDDALDESGLERLMSIFETKGRERGTVLIISHNSLGDWCREVCTVTMKGGLATVTGCLTT